MASSFKNELKDQIDGQTDEHKEIVIEKETQKFMEIFNRVFSEGENENLIEDMDEIDGFVEDVFNTIVSKVKTILKHQFIRKLLEEEEDEDGENKISSEKET